MPIKMQIGLIHKYYTTYFAELSNPTENAIKKIMPQGMCSLASKKEWGWQSDLCHPGVMLGYSPGRKMLFRVVYRVLLAFDVLVNDIRHKVLSLSYS